MMNQSHHGSHAGEKAWDRLAIVVDKTQSPKIARFYQLESGPLEWREGLAEKPFKVSCFMCHNNGPRVIRPNYDSPFDPTSLKDRLKISYWNLGVKLYGRVKASPHHDERDMSQLPPFRFRSSYENERLQVATCIKCHKESGFLARGALSRQQVPTIKFMLEMGQMPPLGFRMSAQEKQELQLFLEGF
ncbi:MAG: cytochrome c [Bdellovibrionales bacterium]|nr:cytochrome c [Bdellovibrionales bacterium]